MANVGYARVSSTDQNLIAQEDRLKLAGCERMFAEKQSGKEADNRHELQTALEWVREGDVLIVTKLDRLARSSVDLGRIAEILTEKKVDLKVLDQEIDTTSSTGRLMFNMIGAFAEFERDLIRDRCAEGIEKARSRGVKFGAPKKLSTKQLNALKQEFDEGVMARSALAKKYGVSRATVYRLLTSS
jgi:DNA invertase Pin-like site-specific DNA recombinase